jgi:hypothetical protein
MGISNQSTRSVNIAIEKRMIIGVVAPETGGADADNCLSRERVCRG